MQPNLLTPAELVAMAKGWTIVGKDLLSVVSCTSPYEWRQGTNPEWEFAPKVKAATGGNPFHVSAVSLGPIRRACMHACCPRREEGGAACCQNHVVHAASGACTLMLPRCFGWVFIAQGMPPAPACP